MHNTVFPFIKMKVYNNDICSIYNNDFTTKNYILMSWSAASCLYQVGAVFANRRIRLWKKKRKNKYSNMLIVTIFQHLLYPMSAQSVKKRNGCTLATAHKKIHHTLAGAEKSVKFRVWPSGIKRIFTIPPVLKYALLRPGRSNMKAPCNLLPLGRSRAQLVITLFSGLAL